MSTSLLMLTVIVLAVLYQNISKRLRDLTDQLQQREEAHTELQITVEQLRQELLRLPRVAATASPAPVPVEAALVTRREPVPPALTVVPVVTPPTPVTPPVAPALPIPAPVVAAVPPAPAAAASPVAEAALVTPTPAVASPAPVTPPPTTQPPVTPPMPRPAPAPQPDRVPALRPTPARPQPTQPAGPTWWDRTEQLLLDNWTGVLGAMVLVTGIGFLGIYTALRVSAPARFGMITGFAAVLLGLHYYLRPRPFAAKLHVWLQSSAAAIFLFACVGAVSVPGLQWAEPPLSYLLLLAGVAVNLWLAWDARRETVATLHGVLSLVALAVLPHNLLTLAATAGVTVFSIGITYRQRWKYQLLLSILSFFAFHQYWHQGVTEVATGVLPTAVRLPAMALVLLVGVAGAVVQYRKVYATVRFDALLFAAHVLNWTCLGINLYRYSTGSPWKTIPLGLGALFTFWVARQARQLGIGWLFRTDSIISLMLALFAAFSLQGWHASGTLILLFMLLETLLVAFVMAREQEKVVFQVASVGALLAGLGLVLLNLTQLGTYTAAELPRNAFLLLLAGLLGAAYYLLLQQTAWLQNDSESRSRDMQQTFGGVVGALYLGAGALLAKAVFGFAQPPLFALLSGTLAAAGAVFGVAWWLRATGGWFRTLHLLCGQALLVVALLGLHEAGLGWPATLLLLYLETLLLAGACGWVREANAYRALLGATLLSGIIFLLTCTGTVRELEAGELHRRLLLLSAAGLSSSVLLMLPVLRTGWQRLLAPAHTTSLQQTLFGLTLLLYLGATGLFVQAVFGQAQPPLGALLGGGSAAAGLLFGLAYWWRGQRGWFRPAHLLLGQLVLAVSMMGLHELGLSWPATVTLLYAELLLFTIALAWQQETGLYRGLLLFTMALAVALPFLVCRLDSLADLQRAALLVGAALATVATQRWLHWQQAPVLDAVPLSDDPRHRVRLLGLLPAGQLLAAGGLVYAHTWAGWVAAGLLAGLLLVRRRFAVPGLWLGVVLTTIGYQVLQWNHALPATAVFQPLQVMSYLLPLLLVAATGLFTSWWPAASQQVRAPWLYLLGVQATLLSWVAFAPRAEALPALLWLLLAALTATAAHRARRHYATPETLHRAGSPDRFLLHLTYALLALGLLGHFHVLLDNPTDLLPGLPDRRLTAGATLLLLGGLAWQRTPASEPLYRSWRYLQPLLPEALLLFAGFTIGYEIRTEWLPLLWVAGAFGLTLGGARLPWHLRRVQVYGLLFFGAAVLCSGYVSVRYLAPGQLLTVPWMVSFGAVALLFAYAAVRLQTAAVRPAYWPPMLAPLAGLGHISPALLVPLLLYPAFGALTLLLVQSFDHSVLTVLLMLEVVAAFVCSLLLRRPDLRYVALAGMALSLARLLFFDLRQTGTITRAVVFILMGLLLLGMNALYARFKSRFEPQPTPKEPGPEFPLEPSASMEPVE
ncbi:hypothetical protein [Hymenobacter swuensis]|uniref:DUF2339 domain-containing protein n=1 Tax=Hymenobacter swuensis DY53 TaxID=1227739 RepID=W8EUR4_9BACT|nr:hypothetical protein [Hymenobacter swuensis]AHJ96288.1 hypothetical protein Hsw_0693 [Hymenobacter swuensis DY53]